MAPTVDYLARLRSILEELRACPAVTLVAAEVKPAEAPVDEEYEADLQADGDLTLDQGMRDYFSQVASVTIHWEVDPRSVPTLAKENTHTRPGGYIRVPELWEIASATVSDMQAMAPRSSDERQYLREVRFIDLADAGQWTALRARPGKTPTLWARTTGADGRAPCDAPLTLSFSEYVEHLLSTRGAYRWPALFMNAAKLAAGDRRAIARYDLKAVRANLSALAMVPGAEEDAARYQALCEEVAARIGAP